MHDSVKELEQKGWEALNRERFADAIQAFHEVFRLDPKNLAAYQATTAALRLQGKLVEAETLLTAARAEHPKAPGILAEWAWLSLARKDYDQAIQAFDARLAAKPEEESLFRWRISVLRVCGRFADAEQRIQEAEKHFPGNLLFPSERGWLRFSQKKYDQAIEIFQAVLVKAPNQDFALQGRVASLRMKGCFKEALRYADVAVDRCPESPGVYSERAWLRLAQGELTHAKDDMATAFRLAPNDADGRLSFAMVLIRRSESNDLDAAEEHCRAVLERHPVLAEAFGCLGVIAHKQGRLREAEDHLVRSVGLDPAKGYHGELAGLYLDTGRYEEARARLDEALRLDPNNLYVRMQMGELHLLTDKPKEAVRECRGAAKIDPRNPDVQRALAIAHIEAGELAEAERVLRTAIHRLDSSQVWELRLTLCQLLARLGDDNAENRYYEEALSEAVTAARLKPGQSGPHFHQGIVYSKLDDLPAALQSFMRCLSYDKDNMMAGVNAERIRARLREKSEARVSRSMSIELTAVFIIVLAALWALHVFYTEKISETTLTVLTPVLLGLLVVSALLPWLTRLKLTGLEAELSAPKPKETLPSGQRVEIGFNRNAPKG